MNNLLINAIIHNVDTAPQAKTFEPGQQVHEIQARFVNTEKAIA